MKFKKSGKISSFFHVVTLKLLGNNHDDCHAINIGISHDYCHAINIGESMHQFSKAAPIMAGGDMT